VREKVCAGRCEALRRVRTFVMIEEVSLKMVVVEEKCICCEPLKSRSATMAEKWLPWCA
jgi:hypothetical protein